MKLHWFFLSLFILLFGQCTVHETTSTSKTYQVNYSERALNIDGNINEDQWENADWSNDYINIEGSQKPSPTYRTRMKMLWDRHYLYIGAEMEEPHLWATLTEHDAIIYRDNDFEVFIDPDKDGLNYYELEINALGNILDLFLEKPYNKKGTADLKWNFEGLKTAVNLNGSMNNPDDSDDGWTVEIAIPWKSLTANDPSSPKNGDKWKMNFSRVQWDLEVKDGKYQKLDKPEHNWVWSPQGKINMHIPEKWGEVEFKGRPDDEHSDIPKFWIWMGADPKKTDYQWDSIFRDLNNIGITGILMSADTSVLKRVVPIAEQLDMQVYAWFWTMNRGDAKPEWLSVNQLNQSLVDQKAYVDYYKFMCPALPDVKAYLKQKMSELTKIEGLKGIHMDYIRYVDVILPVGLWPKYDLVQDYIMPEYDYGYHPYMRKLFKDKYGYDPMEIEDVSHDLLWLDFRLTELNKTVIDMRDKVNQTNLNISAAVFPNPAMAKEMVRQDWKNWDLDFYFPMVYHNFYNEDIDWIREVMAENRAAISMESKLFCGLYLPALIEGNDLSLAIQAAFEGGADGIAFFDLNALTDGQKEQIMQCIQNQ